MFRHKTLLRNLTKCSQCQLKKRSIRGFHSASFCNLVCPHTVSSRIVTKGLAELNPLQHKILEGSFRKYFSKFSDAKCWKCKQYLEVKKFTCASCGALQYPKPNINYFELFGISQTFDVDLEDLSAKFKNLQMIFHPDKFVNKSKEELEISEMYSRLVNKAYSTLKDPLKRGFYILELQKVPADTTFPLGQEFLMTVMERNEELESINNENILSKFTKINNEELEKQLSLVSHAFQRSKWSDARQNLLKLNYFVNLDSKIKKKENDILSSKNT